jgi:hypothetical protein
LDDEQIFVHLDEGAANALPLVQLKTKRDLFQDLKKRN